MSARITERIADQIRAQRVRLQLAAAGGAVVTAAATCLLGLSGWFIASAALAGLAGGAAAHAFNYMMPSAVIRLLAILRTGARYVERVAGHEAALKALARLRPELFGSIARGPLTKALGVSSGELSARLVQDVDAIQTLFVRRSAPWSLGAGATAALLLTGLASPFSALWLAFVMAVTCAGCVLIARRLADPAGRLAQAVVGAFKDRLSALEAGAPELKAYGLNDWAVREVETAASRYDHARVALAHAGGWIGVWQACATAIALAGVVVISADVPVPLIALTALATVMGLESAGGVATALHQNGSAREALERLASLLSDAAPETSKQTLQPSLTLSAIARPFDPPARVGIHGPSGSGKTTLIERLIGLREASPGDARIGGLDAASLTPAERRTLFAYAAQDIRLLDDTIRQNLLVAGPADDATLWAALEDAALAERVRADPMGLDARIGSNGQKLSGGERRRLGLARAYLRDAPWLVLDEPTEGLDADTEARVLVSLARRLSAGRQGLILVSHRSSPLALCDRLYRTARLAGEGRVLLEPLQTT